MENHMPIGKIIMRLVILKNYITLGDIDEIQRESEKLTQFSEHTDLNDILYSIQNKELSKAVVLIDSFITTHQQLAVWISGYYPFKTLNMFLQIGNQIWMVENLNVDRFRNGDPIPEARSDEEWENAGLNQKPAWCYYKNDPANGTKYGKLYNWYAVNDPRGLAPEGWHIPSGKEWRLLTNFLGGEEAAGHKMKSTGGWNEKGNGSNTSGFSGLPGGGNDEDGFDGIGNYGYWWSSTDYLSSGVRLAWHRILSYDDGLVLRSGSRKHYGFSVRCLRD